jgi:3-phenylpropionate/trans-cinnamate dioxygenase ferredoxin subunit
MGCSLKAGRLDGYIITCPCHDWRFDVRTGEFLDAKEIKIPTYKVELQDGKIFLTI